LRFNKRIPDEFPFIDYAVREPGDIPGLAVLIEEFLHRCQWAATPFGLVFRAAVLVQVRETIRILRTLAKDSSLVLPTPWLDIRSTPDDTTLAVSLRTVQALEVLQRFLLGVPLGRPTSELRNAVAISKAALIQSSPLSFGTFQSWSAENVIYRLDGSPIHSRTTRGIMESHASAYAIELLRSCSQRPANWFDEYIRTNRVGLYSALEELAQAGGVSFPLMSIRHLLYLADVSINIQMADIVGFPPPPDYLDEMLPYKRYALALQDVITASHEWEFIIEDERDKHDDAKRLNFAIDYAITIRGQASPFYGLEPLSRRSAMERNIHATWQWEAQELGLLDSSGDIGTLEAMLIGALTYSSIRFFKINAEMSTDSTLFEPTLSRFVFLARFCDWPVIEYGDNVEVFLCDPMSDPRSVVTSQITIYELTRMARRLLVESCRMFDGPSWSLSTIRQRPPLINVIGVDANQLTG
jgi:hypothetical protein